MHYANGREAVVGDLVVGYGYNTATKDVPFGGGGDPTSKRLVGTLVKAVAGGDRCNAELEWVESVAVEAGKPLSRPRMAQGEPRLYVTPQGEIRAHFICRDYTHCGALLHVEDVIALRAVDDGSLVAVLQALEPSTVPIPPPAPVVTELPVAEAAPATLVTP